MVSKTLLASGYDTVVVDYLWYQYLQEDNVWRIDGSGYPLPALDRWPSAAGSGGFRQVASKVHAMGLKFGVHLMRGISSFAIKANTTFPGAPEGATTATIATSHVCGWDGDSFSVNMSAPGGQEWVNGMISLYASWGVDFIKLDCVTGGSYDASQVQMMAKAILNSKSTITLSTSPGFSSSKPGGPTEYATDIVPYSNMARVASDDWDHVNDILAHFPFASNFLHLNHKEGLGGGKFFSDLDMLPFGYIAEPCGNHGSPPPSKCYPHKQSSLSAGEERIQFTLWCFAQSPLFFGGDMMRTDADTIQRITNAKLLQINQEAVNNNCVSGCSNSSSPSSLVTWKAMLGTSTFIAAFNPTSTSQNISLPLKDYGIDSVCTGTDVWSGEMLPGNIKYNLDITSPALDARVIELQC